ncbi:ALK and LTK ligand 2b [Lepisosteus oculatus]|nr:PREDICTED: protein FAM150B [Lepisosteus oculatus]XP_015213224.1 PREDICTED: protein FAM150B [Lepisosteus oculatus]
MSKPRSPFFLGLVLLLLTAGYCKESTESTDTKNSQALLKLIMDTVKHLKKHHTEQNENIVQYISKHSDYSLDPKEQQHIDKSYHEDHHEDHIVEIFPRDLRTKEKFLKHLTGPLTVSPKCSKHFYRLYHNTRDCTIPAYYRRCARLLTRLAGSSRCMEG